MLQRKRSNELIVHGLAVLFFIVATVASAMSAFHGWSTLLFFPTYVLGFIIVVSTSIIVLVRDTFFRFKSVLLISSFLFAISSFFIVGDNGDADGIYYMGKVYSPVGQNYYSYPHLPTLVRIFDVVAYPAFFGFGLISMICMIIFASSAKRT